LLNRLFKNPSEKLQKILKVSFAVLTCGGGFLIFLRYLTTIVAVAKYYNKIQNILFNTMYQIAMMIIVLLLFGFGMYILHLFAHMVVNYFDDVHNIKNSLKQKE
jgi:hypothetical protein